ncbi:hypothetical protein ABFP60_12265 [Clostridioides difficile]
MEKFKKIIRRIYNYITLNLKEFIKNLRDIKSLGVKETLKRTWGGIAVLLSLIIVSFLVVYSNCSTSKEKVLEGFKNALISADSGKVCKYVRVDDERASAKELEPLIKYYGGQEKRIKSIESELRNEGKSGNFILQSKNGLLRDKYYISISTVVVEFTTDTKNVDVQFGNKKFKLVDKAEFDVIPGSYDVNYNYNTEYGNITEDMNVDLIANKTIELKVNGNYITLYSNFDDAKVFIDNIDTNLQAKDIKNYGPIPKDKEVVMYLQRDFPWGDIKSENININNQQYVKLDINMVNDELMTMVSKIVNEFYSSSFEALNNRDKELIINSTATVKDTVYNYINEKAFLFSNNYEITDLQVEIEKSDFKYEEEKYKASLVTKINYNVYKKLLPFIKTPNESSFILNLEYNEGAFIINGIQKVDI